MLIPLTFSFADALAVPALFSALQVYKPPCSSFTESILITLVLGPAFVISIPSL